MQAWHWVSYVCSGHSFISRGSGQSNEDWRKPGIGIRPPSPQRARLMECSEYRWKSHILGTKLREEPPFVWLRGRRTRNQKWPRASRADRPGGEGLKEHGVVIRKGFLGQMRL